MATPVLSNADHFDFTNLSGERLDLYGSLVSWSHEIQTGVVEKRVVKRAGAIHQSVGRPPRRFEYRCVIRGADVRTRYNRVVDVVLQEPEGRITDPRFGNIRAVVESIGSAESPADQIDTVEFTLKVSETGLKDPPRPAPSALAAAAAAQGTSARSQSASLGAAIAGAGVAVETRSTGFLIAMAAAETGSGTLLDVDASLSALAAAATTLTTLDAPQAVRRAAAVSLGNAIAARNRFTEGRPPIIRYELRSPESLSSLCQRLYGGRGKNEAALIGRLNRLSRPYSLPTGTVLLLTDPAVAVPA